MASTNSFMKVFGGDVPHPLGREQLAHVVAHGVEQVGLAQTGVAVDEQRVVGRRRLLGHRHGRSVGEAVRRPDHELLEGVVRIQGGPHPLVAWIERRARRGAVGDSGPGEKPQSVLDGVIHRIAWCRLHEELDVDRRVGDLPERVGDRRGVGRLDPVAGHLVGHRQSEHAVLEVERLDAGQPRAIRRVTKLGAEQAADGLPEVVGRLGSELFFHRGIHRCGQQGYDGELVQVVHEVAQQRTRSGLRGSAPPSR